METLNFCEKSTKPLEDKKEILIVGGGMAGLSCAVSLSSFSNVRITIIEARKRLGGRINTRTITVPKCNPTEGQTELEVPLDMGAMWIHGLLGNPLLSFANKHGIKLSPPEEEEQQTVATFIDGKRIPTELDMELEEQVGNLHETLIFERARRSSPDFSFRDGYKREKETVTNIKNNLKRQMSLSEEELQRIFEAKISGFEVHNGGTAEEISVRNYSDYEDDIGGESLVLNGYSQFLEKMIETLKETGRVRFLTGHKVKKISYQQDRNKVIILGEENQEEEDSFDSTTKTAFDLEADAAVITVPLGVLKASTIEFDPPLPESKLGSISRLGMGLLNKVFLVFSKTLWDQNVEWINTASDLVPWFLNLQHFSNQKDTAVLVGFVGVKHAKDFEKLEDQEAIEEVLDILEKQMGKGSIRQHFVKGMMTRWNCDPFSRGSYSFSPIGSSPLDFDQLAEPLLDRSLFFAGEATHRKHFGNADAAYISGVREAARVAAHLHLDEAKASPCIN